MKWLLLLSLPPLPPFRLLWSGNSDRLYFPGLRNRCGQWLQPWNSKTLGSWVDFLDSSVGKESTCSAGGPSSIPGSGRSPGKGKGYPLQYCWASLVAQLVKNPPAMRRPGFSPWLGKIPWRRERLPTPVFWLENSMDCIVQEVAKSRTQLSDCHFYFCILVALLFVHCIYA